MQTMELFLKTLTFTFQLDNFVIYKYFKAKLYLLQLYDISLIHILLSTKDDEHPQSSAPVIRQTRLWIIM